jgi:deoxyribose-phosphate aldolase
MRKVSKPRDVIGLLEVSLLRPDATETEIRKLCEDARDYKFAVLFAMSSWLPLTKDLLKGSGVRVGASIGFPLGSHSTYVKVAETRDALASGADDIDMVMNIGAFKSGQFDSVERDIHAVVEAAPGHIVKVIIETCLLSNDEKRHACLICKKAGADYVKTSSGFSRGGATIEDIVLMRQTVGIEMGVKAAGGIRTLEEAIRFIEAGADGLGTSAAVAIAEEARKRELGSYT